MAKINSSTLVRSTLQTKQAKRTSATCCSVWRTMASSYDADGLSTSPDRTDCPPLSQPNSVTSDTRITIVMAIIAAPGRESIPKDLHFEEKQLKGFRAGWHNIFEQHRLLPVEPRYPTVSVSTPLEEVLKYLADFEKNINTRLCMLSAQGDLINDDGYINLAATFQRALSSPRGLDTARWTFIQTVPAAEREAVRMQVLLIELEGLHHHLIVRLLHSVQDFIDL